MQRAVSMLPGGKNAMLEYDLNTRNAPLYSMATAVRIIGASAQVLRCYEKHGLVLPARNGRARFYTSNDIKWLRCVRELIHVNKISIEGIKKLLIYAPCWEIKDCSDAERHECSSFAVARIRRMMPDNHWTDRGACGYFTGDPFPAAPRGLLRPKP